MVVVMVVAAGMDVTLDSHAQQLRQFSQYRFLVRWTLESSCRRPTNSQTSVHLALQSGQGLSQPSSQPPTSNTSAAPPPFPSPAGLSVRELSAPRHSFPHSTDAFWHCCLRGGGQTAALAQPTQPCSERATAVASAALRSSVQACAASKVVAQPRRNSCHSPKIPTNLLALGFGNRGYEEFILARSVGARWLVDFRQTARTVCGRDDCCCCCCC
ncbi:hypothetical protein HDK90DRAFT_54404 [Phyllosticta capitalensis]|uniref:Uncharacterized protein n=1 Tax=Phyllosticta capitalensis TaxID=121624 RepID=A0ABR1YE76_9PEZI